MRTRHWLMAAVAAVALPVAAPAQESADSTGVELGWFGLSVEYGRATGAFSNYVRDGLGGFGWIAAPVGRESPFHVRLAGHVLSYGTSTRSWSLVPGIDVDVTTSNLVAGLMIGPHFQPRSGALGAYAYGEIGFNYFVTTSSVSGSNDIDTFASSTNFGDFTFAGELGGGLLVRFSRTVALDLGARYVRNGEVTYVTKERITITGNTMDVNPVTSDANLVIYHLGLTFRLTHGPADEIKEP